MKSQALGKNILDVEVSHISRHGIWLCLHDKEYFLPYESYPWFKDATISEIHQVKLVNGTRLEWSDLDVELEVESLENPTKYPLIYK